MVGTLQEITMAAEPIQEGFTTHGYLRITIGMIRPVSLALIPSFNSNDKKEGFHNHESAEKINFVRVAAC